jgi:RNA polymerase sigma-70 factor (ECF subfamily)
VVEKTDIEIIEEVKAGGISSYSVLINRYKNLVFMLAFNILQNKEDAEELAQDAFVKVYNALATFKANSLFSTWLYRIVINASLNKKKLNKIKLIADDTIINVEDDNVDSLLEQQEKNDRKKIVQSAIALLKTDERICITLFYLNELSILEINELTDISIANIKVLLHRGRKNLYNHLSTLLKSEIKNLV